MIFEAIIIFILLFVIVGLIYQFMFDIFIWVLIGSIVFFVLYLTVELFVHFRKKRLSQKEGSELKFEPETESKEDTKEVKGATKEEVKKEPVVEVDKDLEMLKAFIQKNLKQGFKEKIISQALTKQGWPKDKINLAFK